MVIAYSWSSMVRQPDWAEADPWSAYVERGGRPAIGALERGHRENDAAEGVLARLRYNLTYTREGEFPSLGAIPR